MRFLQNLLLIAILALLNACSHPLEPRGAGDILSATGKRDCFLEDFQAGADSCTQNLVVGEYRETYYANPRAGWQFEHWENYCTDGKSGAQCSFEIPAAAVRDNWGRTVPPLVAVFSPLPSPPVFDDIDRDGNVSFSSALSIPDQGTTRGTVDSADDIDFFAFTAAATASYSAALEFPRPDLYLLLYAGDGSDELLAESREAGVTRQLIAGRLLEQGKTYFLAVQAASQSQTQDYQLSLSQEAPRFGPGTALYSYSLDADGRLENPQALQGANLQRKTVYFSFFGDYRQVSFWCCKVPAGREGHAPRIDDSNPPFVVEVDLSRLPNDDGLERELYADLFLPGGGYLNDNLAYWTLEPKPEPPKFSLSGEIQVGASQVTDKDVNHPGAPFSSNNTPFTAQALPNPAIVNGFVSAVGSGRAGDRFADFPDPVDIFKASLISGQSLNLQVANHDASEPARNDIDLYVFDDQQQLVLASNGTGEFESIVLESSGSYFIQVVAHTGLGKYVLSIGDDFTAGRSAGSQIGNGFVGNELLIAYQEDKSQLAAANAMATREILAAQGVSTLAEGAGPQRLKLDGAAQTGALIASLSPGDGEGRLLQPTVTPSAPRGQSTTPVDPKYLALKLAKALRGRNDVRYAEPNYRLQAAASANDTYYQLQWHYPFMELPAAWDISTGSANAAPPLVAVVDTGVLLGHPDMEGQLVGGYDFISDPRVAADGDGIDPNPDDVGDREGPSQRSGFHGTHVAGTIAARSNNNMGVAGVAWGASIMPVRVLGVGGGTGYDLTQGILFAAGLANDSGQLPPRRADIINLSLGCSNCFSSGLSEAIRAAREAGVIVVAAAGNNASSVPFYPAAYEGVIGVSSIHSGSGLAAYSNFGSIIDLAAPGGDGFDRDADGFADGIFSTLGDDSSGSIAFRYGWSSGTSMAAPHVAGVAALMKAVHPGLTPAEFDQAIRSGGAVSDLGPQGRDDQFGYGAINALKAVQFARALAGGTQPGIVTANPTVLDFPHGLDSRSFTVSAQGSGAPIVTAVDTGQEWLTVTPAPGVDSNGMGDYVVQVRRTALAAAVYRGEVRFTLSDDTILVLPVYMQVLNPGFGAGDVGLLELQIQDASTLAVVNRLNVVPGDGGRYRYRFDASVAAGDYRVYAGSDIDHDGILCGRGETCGGWPILDSPENISVDRDLDAIDFKLSTGTDFGIAR
jgi:serine protease